MVPEYLGSVWRCSFCSFRGVGTKTLKISTVPHFLIVQLQRFKMTAEGRWVKDNKMINFNLVDFKLCGRSYFLIAVINHHGSRNSGHYTSMVLRNEEWWQINDTAVKKIGASQVKQKSAYILFYSSNEEDELMVDRWAGVVTIHPLFLTVSQ